MPSKKPIFTLRTDQELLDKLHFIAEEETRSDNKQLEHILRQAVKAYEAEHGEIQTDRAEN